VNHSIKPLLPIFNAREDCRRRENLERATHRKAFIAAIIGRLSGYGIEYGNTQAPPTLALDLAKLAGQFREASARLPSMSRTNHRSSYRTNDEVAASDHLVTPFKLRVLLKRFGRASSWGYIGA
jgi:hypothetical protein